MYLREIFPLNYIQRYFYKGRKERQEVSTAIINEYRRSEGEERFFDDPVETYSGCETN